MWKDTPYIIQQAGVPGWLKSQQKLNSDVHLFPDCRHDVTSCLGLLPPCLPRLKLWTKITLSFLKWLYLAFLSQQQKKKKCNLYTTQTWVWTCSHSQSYVQKWFLPWLYLPEMHLISSDLRSQNWLVFERHNLSFKAIRQVTFTEDNITGGWMTSHIKVGNSRSNVRLFSQLTQSTLQNWYGLVRNRVQSSKQSSTYRSRTLAGEKLSTPAASHKGESKQRYRKKPVLRYEFRI